MQCMSTTIHSLSNQTFYWSNIALYIQDAFLDEYQRCFYTVLNSRPFALKPTTMPLHHGGYSQNSKSICKNFLGFRQFETQYLCNRASYFLMPSVDFANQSICLYSLEVIFRQKIDTCLKRKFKIDAFDLCCVKNRIV